MNRGSLKSSERGKEEKSTERLINMKYVLFFAVVIVVLKEACNELRECGISNPLLCHEEQKCEEPVRSQTS